MLRTKPETPQRSSNQESCNTKKPLAPAGPQPGTVPNPGVAGILGPLSEYIGYSVQCAQMAIFQDFIRTLTLVDLRPAQFSALTLIDANPGYCKHALPKLSR